MAMPGAKACLLIDRDQSVALPIVLGSTAYSLPIQCVRILQPLYHIKVRHLCFLAQRSGH
jgi:hypothetical protein